MLSRDASAEKKQLHGDVLLQRNIVDHEIPIH